MQLSQFILILTPFVSSSLSHSGSEISPYNQNSRRLRSSSSIHPTWILFRLLSFGKAREVPAYSSSLSGFIVHIACTHASSYSTVLAYSVLCIGRQQITLDFGRCRRLKPSDLFIEGKDNWPLHIRFRMEYSVFKIRNIVFVLWLFIQWVTAMVHFILHLRKRGIIFKCS